MTDKKRLTAADKTVITLRAAIENRRFSDIVEATGFAKATVHRILQTLLDYQLVTLTSSGEYIPGSAALKLAGSALSAIDISEIATPFLANLASTTGYTVHLAALNHDEAIYIAKCNGSTPYYIPSGLGQRLPLHTTAIGKCLMADFSYDDVVNHAVDHGLKPRTPNTITTLDAYLDELSRIRARGYSFDDEENVPGIRCVGAPVFGMQGKATHGLSMTALAMEKTLDELEEYAELVVGCARNISEALGAPDYGYAGVE